MLGVAPQIVSRFSLLCTIDWNKLNRKATFKMTQEGYCTFFGVCFVRTSVIVRRLKQLALHSATRVQH